jgi:hypothetical protein
MKRDVDLQRQILLFIEEQAPPSGGLDKPIAIDGYDKATIFAHTEFLIDEGLIDAAVSRGMFGIIDVRVERVKAAGHDAIAAARNDTGWQKAKKIVKDKGIAATFALLIELAKLEARSHLGLP